MHTLSRHILLVDRVGYHLGMAEQDRRTFAAPAVGAVSREPLDPEFLADLEEAERRYASILERLADA